MKKPAFLSALILVASLCFSQVDTISHNIYQNNNRLGIGTLNPTSALEIFDTVHSGDARYLIKLNNPSTSTYSTCGLLLRAGEGTDYGAINFTSETYNDPNQVDAANAMLLGTNAKSIALHVNKPEGYIKFSTGGLSGSYPAFERMRINGVGNIGINTTEPVEKLDVNGGIRVGNSENANPGTIRWTGADFEGYTGASWSSFTNEHNENYWSKNGNDLYYLNGKVGIGTNSPENALSLIGNEDEWPGRIFISVKNTSTSGKSLSYIKLQAGPTASGTSLGHISSTYTSCDNYQEIADFGRLTSSGNGIMIDATKADMSAGIIKFCSGQGPGTAYIERMRIDRSGNIGIGTPSPDVKLRIEGNVDNGPERALLRLKNLSTGSNSSVSVGLESNNSVYGLALTLTSEQYAGINDFDRMGAISVNGKGFSIYSTSDYGTIRFYTKMESTGKNERMRISADGNIGIGTKEPVEKLDIQGGLRIGNTENNNPGSIRWTGADFEGFDGTNWVSFTNGSGVEYWNLNGNDLNYMNGKVGIGTINPSSALEIYNEVSSGDGRYLIKLQNPSTSSYSTCGLRLMAGNGSEFGAINFTSETYNDPNQVDAANAMLLGTNARSIALHVNQPEGYIKFSTGGLSGAGGYPAFERMRIDGAGNIGIGTHSPSAKLQIADGDIYISDIDQGIIMKSPDGQCWRGPIDNTGTLNFAPVKCPELPASIEVQTDDQNSDLVNVFPNPTRNCVTVQINGNSSGKILKIYTIGGVLISSKNLQSNLSEIDLTDFKEGIYLFNIEDSAGKFISSVNVIKR
jgi:hypothetical protein